jgi:preprotein translocase subunit SecA
VPVGVGAGGQFADGAQPTPQHMDEALQPVVKAPSEKLGRNEPCWCGSGKKFKLCHGAG